MKIISGVRVDVCVESVDGSEYDDIDYDDCLAIFKSEKGMINFVTEKMLGGYGLEELQNYITNPKYSDCVEIHETDFADFDEDDEDGEKNDIEVTIASSSKEKVALVPFDSEDFKYRWCVQISYYENDVEEDTSEYEFADLTESRQRRGRMLREEENSFVAWEDPRTLEDFIEELEDLRHHSKNLTQKQYTLMIELTDFLKKLSKKMKW